MKQRHWFERNFKAIVVLVGITLILLGCSPERGTGTQGDDPGSANSEVIMNTNPTPSPDFSAIEDPDEIANIQTTEDGEKYLINPREIISGGPPKDGIPSIDNPKYTSADEADNWLTDDELVLGIEYKGETRAYPLQVLVWHEIVNDVIAGDPLLITYCPLCMTGIAYHRVLDGEAVEFGTSGKLYNSNLVMYDRLTDSYWSQIEGRAIVGELTGHVLQPIGVDTISYGDWKNKFPETLVLTRDTGHNRQYGRDPYGSYYTSEELFFDVSAENRVVHPKTVIYGIEINGHFRAYKEDDIRNQGEIIEEVNNVQVTVTSDDIGRVLVKNSVTGEEIPRERGFWFSWYAFHPNTTLYGFELNIEKELNSPESGN